MNSLTADSPMSDFMRGGGASQGTKQPLRIGLFGARADNSGLGQQTFEFFRHMRPYKTLVVDISMYSNKPADAGKYYEVAAEWTETENYVYEVKGFPKDQDCKDFLHDLDVVFCCEIPYNYNLFRKAKQLGVKTVLQPNFEFLDYLQEPNLPYPDALTFPSDWHFNECVLRFRDKTRVMFMPTPVNRDLIPYVERTQAKTFVHIVGYKTYEDRNGSEIVFKAIPMVKNPDARFILYTSYELPQEVTSDPRVEVRPFATNYWELYEDGDVLLLPRRYGGQSLLVNEAMSSGMIPVMPACPPNDTIINQGCLLATAGRRTIKTRSEIDCWDVDPKEVAEVVEDFMRTPEDTIRALSQWSNNYAQSISWEVYQPKFTKLFEDLVNGTLN